MNFTEMKNYNTFKAPQSIKIVREKIKPIFSPEKIVDSSVTSRKSSVVTLRGSHSVSVNKQFRAIRRNSKKKQGRVQSCISLGKYSILEKKDSRNNIFRQQYTS
jgi:hypothetical protein